MPNEPFLLNKTAYPVNLVCFSMMSVSLSARKTAGDGYAGSCTTDKVTFILSTPEYICSLNEYLVFMIFLADFRAWGHLRYLTPFHNDVLLVDGKQNHFYTESFIDRQPETLGKVQTVPGGGTPHMKGVGMLVGNFELNP